MHEGNHSLIVSHTFVATVLKFFLYDHNSACCSWNVRRQEFEETTPLQFFKAKWDLGSVLSV